MRTRLLIFIIIIILLVDLAFLYPQLTEKTVYEIKITNITRVIDGDTFEADDLKIRLLGINAPEKSQLYYEEAKNFLGQFKGKEVALESHEKDKYNRELGYIHYNKKLVNLEILKKGLAHLYYYQEDRYFSDMQEAEKSARDKQIGIWKKSDNFGCVELIKLKCFDEEGSENQEQLVLNNKCEEMSVILKDDATHIYNLELEKGLFTKNFTKIWNDDGDSLYLWDENGLLLFERYG